MNSLRYACLVGVVLLSACASTPDEELVSTATSSTSSTTIATTAAPTTTVDATSTPTTEPNLETTVVETTDPERPVPCRTITNFADDTANNTWLVVNDNVMGGRSLGDREFINEVMVFSGSINTNGGGFSSLRLPLDSDALADADRIMIHARSDGRRYMLTFDDNLDGRDSRISFRAPIEFDTPGEWETATVFVDDLFAAAFGQPVVTDPFRQDLVTRMGIMLSDGVDGEFRLEVDVIDVC